MDDDSRPGEWSVPCGHQEKNENKLSCAVRELYEETNIKLRPGDLNYIGGIKTTDGKNVKGIMSVFLYDSEDEILPDLTDAKDGQEHEDCGYFGLDNLPRPIGGGLEEIVKKVLINHGPTRR
jgi:8-oxo-dGTP pyrophosphatase MutT (NUDIX family)